MAYLTNSEKAKEVQETREKLQRYLEPFNRDANAILGRGWSSLRRSQ